MTVHISAEPGQIAETVLLPGDPLRAEWAAKRFLTDPVLVNRTRGMSGYTGTWKGQRVTIQGSGMGMPSLSIYVNELIRDFGAKTIIRIGSCGGMQEKVGLTYCSTATMTCNQLIQSSFGTAIPSIPRCRRPTGAASSAPAGRRTTRDS